MALSDYRMLARKSPLPLSLTQIAVLEAFLAASVIFLAARFEPFTRLLTLVILVLWIFLHMTT
jgi:hypothetical protein